MTATMKRVSQVLAFAIVAVAATATLVLAGLREDTLQGQEARAACLARCPTVLAGALR